jgi:hypothetical protein
MKRIRITCILLAGLGIFGCSKQPSSPNLHVPFISSIVWDSTNSIRGYLCCVTLRDDKIGGYTDNYKTLAIFYDSVGQPVLSGGVTFNGTTLPVPPGSHSAFDQSSQNFSTTQSWNVSSSAVVPAISDTISPPSQFQVTFPVNLTDTVSKSSYTVTWNNPGLDSVYILLDYEATYSHMLDTSLHYAEIRSYVKVASTGTFTVPSSMFVGFPNAGVVSTYVIADNTKLITVHGHNYVLRSTTAATSYCHIKS